MRLTVIGLSHKTASIEIRERFFFKEEEREILLNELKGDPCVMEALILSTCNRTEIYAHTLSSGVSDSLIDRLFQIKKIPQDTRLTNHFYFYEGREAMEHLLRVSSGLDSIVLGEQQILGQVKSAVEFSRRKGMLGKYFNILMDTAVRTGKKAQNETPISSGGASVSWAAVAAAQKELGTLRDKSVLIIGAGKMGGIAAGYLQNKGTGHIYLMNRSREKAQLLAREFAGTAVSFLDLEDVLGRVDVCICSAGAPHYLLEKDLVEKVVSVRQGRRLVCVDISIPRNIDPRVEDIDGVSLITIDDLGRVVARNVEKRHAAISQVEAIIAKKIAEFNTKITKNKAVESTGFYEMAEVA
jgi:glutamyl-tRNA reductase